MLLLEKAVEWDDHVPRRQQPRDRQSIGIEAMK
jgi:hypothetical protein